MKTKKIIAAFLAAIMILTAMPVAFAADGDTVILYTNDVHCAVEDYAVLAAYKAQLESEGNTVFLVDAGDAIQGEVIGSKTKGAAIVDIMNATGYDYAAVGNHEFDYGMDVFLDLAQNKAEYEYISSNFYDLTSVTPVLKPYAIEDAGDYQIAFVGISTPDTITSSTPEYFKDDGGNFIYGFPYYPEGMTDEALYNSIQESVDEAIADGADYVVAVGHAGIIGSNDGWKSSDIIANTDGLDVFIDAHSHETTEKAVYKNKENEDVFLTSTGEKFANFGQLTISGDDMSFELINPDNVDVETMSADAKTAYDTVKSKIDGYLEEIAYLYDEIGTSEVKLVVYGDDGSRVVRKRETNAGDFVADAYRAVTGSDVAIANGGGVRADVEAGSVSRKTLMDVNSFNNGMCVLEVTGQQIIDILEHGARKCPEELGSFFQVSGMTFEIHTYRETPVITNQLGDFIGVDETKERRVQNVCIGGEPVDLGEKYTLTGSTYVLIQGGDGLTMLDGARVISQEGLPCDSEMLIKYFTETLGGVIPAEKYGNPDGDGRITIFEKAPDAFYDYEIKYGETITVSVLGGDFDNPKYSYIKFVPEADGRFVLESFADDDTDPFCALFDSELNDLGLWDDYDSLNFRVTENFTKGETYYFGVSVYADSGEFEVTLSCGHTFVDGVCTVCGYECDHEFTPDNQFNCACGKVFKGEIINDGDEIEFDSTGREDFAFFRFVPEESGVYIFESVSESEESDPVCDFYNSDSEYIGVSDDVNGKDFFFICELEAGEAYYFGVWNNVDGAVCKLKLRRAVHTADDGAEHDLEYVAETESTCVEHGYTEGLYCSECDEYAWGHEEKELADWHWDENGDDICDDCGAEIVYEECECLCHIDNWFLSFIWKIANFFHSLFGILPLCECGEMHYLPPFHHMVF